MIGKYVLYSIAHFAFVTLVLKVVGFISPEFLKCYYTSVLNFAVVLLVSKLTFKLTKRRFLNEKIQSTNRSVLITGCDTGFGHCLAKRLDSKGFRVFASCLFPTGPGAEELRKSCSSRLAILGLDVTKDDSVRKAVEYVKENLGTSKLWAIVNNAGVHKGFNLEYSPMDDFKDCMDVNALGPVRVTKAFLPLLRQSKGRVVNIASVVGRRYIPLSTAYIMSKYATVAFNGSLRQELALWGISVVSVEPELFQTEFANKEIVLARMTSSLSAAEKDIRKEYGEAFENTIKKFAVFVLNLASPKVELVVDDLESAVTSQHPDVTYIPRRNYFTRFILYCFTAMPDNFADLIVKFALYLYGFPKSLKKK